VTHNHDTHLLSLPQGSYEIAGNRFRARRPALPIGKPSHNCRPQIHISGDKH